MSKITYYPTMFHTNPFIFNKTEFMDLPVKNGIDVNRNKDVSLEGFKKQKIASELNSMPLNWSSFFESIKKILNTTKRYSGKLINSMGQ